jgi:chemotaxis protein methyltransferase CheR
MAALSEQQLVRFRDLIFNNCGLWFGNSKLPILGNRIKTRLKESGIRDPEKYFETISSDDDRAELSKLINMITTNETYFWRAEAQMDSFRDIILPKLSEKKIAKNKRKLRIWSAGCSTGEEPYTLAICVLETIPFHSIWDIEIYSTDISTEVLNKAMEGCYDKRAVERLPKEYLKKYFIERNGRYIVGNAVRKLVEFEYANLADTYYERNFDVIFCRNVLIYFKDESKKEILARLNDSLNPGGYLFLGPTEMIRGLADGYEMITLKDCVAFQKQPG